ncbi:hypothetical protein KFL_006010010 [Klebsormidium nitens]|uniref:Uncharacterized protein n=1 Tax=Klebsormidium nitens TaxID=105231 RepID=A0A1Y1IGW5_KLENI|nr:hypothetical protein KFL_006010010 [Klebsormidium nitens]|eukprot:GAQ90105.1 hypothetical protein KFL_006010010 [Klebsormidium nitens]
MGSAASFLILKDGIESWSFNFLIMTRCRPHGRSKFDQRKPGRTPLRSALPMAEHTPAASSPPDLDAALPLPDIQRLVMSTFKQGTVKGERLFRRSVAVVRGLARKACGSAGYSWTKAARDGASQVAMRGLEGLLSASESFLREGFNHVVAETAEAYLEGLKHEGNVRGRLQGRKRRTSGVKRGAQRSYREQPTEGLGSQLDHLGPHSLSCHGCGAGAAWGLRGSREGGSIKYFCETHATSSGCFRVDPDRAVWAADHELRRLRAKARRLEQELQDLGGAPKDAPSAPPFAAWQESGGMTDWVSMPKSRSLIATLLMRGGVETNPGPSPHEIARVWREAYPNADPTLLEYLSLHQFKLAEWRALPAQRRSIILTGLKEKYKEPWAVGWSIFLRRAAASTSSDVDMENAESWVEAHPTFHPPLLEYLANQKVQLADWRALPAEAQLESLTELKAHHPAWLIGWDLSLEAIVAVRKGQDGEAGQPEDMDMGDADENNQSYARSDILALQNLANVSDTGLKEPASSSAPHLEKSRDADWYVVQSQCEALINRARGALAKLQIEPQIACFQSPSELPHAAAINKNKIPLARGLPSFLVDRLPSPVFNNVTWTQAAELLDGMKERHTFQNLSVTSFMAASGYGKTRTALEMGCLRPGVLYFSCCGPEEVGSRDLWEMLGRLKVTCKEGSRFWESNHERVQKHVYAMLLSRLKHLSECLSLGCDPQQWLRYQLVVYQGQQDTFAEAYNVLRHASLKDLQELVTAELEACLSTLMADGVEFLILVLDEAQLWAEELPGMFSNGAVKGQQEGRPLLSAFLAVIASDPVLVKNIHVVLSGTGLSLSQSMLVASALMKVGSKPFPVVDFGTFNDASARKYLGDYAGPQDIPEHDLLFLVGRRRFAARVVLDWAQSGQESILTCLRSLVRQHTTKEGRELFLANERRDVYERHFLYGRLGALLKRGAEGMKLLDLLKRVAFAHARLGGPCLFLHHQEFDLVDLGFVKLHHSGKHRIVASIEEPLAVRALFNFLETELKWSAKEHALTLMAQSQPFPAMLGQWFEVVAPDQLPQLFQTEGALADAPLFSNLKSELPECFRREGASLARVQLAPDGKYSFSTVAKPTGLDAPVRLATKGRGVLAWLRDPGGIVWFFPETSAGPDLLFFVVVGGALYLVVCQLKLRWKLDSLARAIQTVDPRYLFEGKVNKEELREVAHEALRAERGVDGVISLLIGYPLRTRMREFVPKKSSAEEEDRKRKSKEEVDDMVEPSVRIVIDGKRKTELLPKELRKFLDAAKNYGELEAEEDDLKEAEEVEAEEGR